MSLDLNQIRLFRSIFRGRDDVFAVRWEKGNKTGYMPSYTFDSHMLRVHKIGGGTFQNYEHKSYKPLTDQQIEKVIWLPDEEPDELLFDEEDEGDEEGAPLLVG